MSKTNARFQAIIFDMDGTITEPVFDFEAIGREVFEATGCTGDIDTYPPDKRQIAWNIIMRHEHHAAQHQAVKPGTHDFLAACRIAGIPCGLLTLNCRENVDALVNKFALAFDKIITREHPNPKPHPAPVKEMTEQWSVLPANTLFVGDYIHDIQCGRSAGTITCFFRNPGCKDFSHEADITVESMHELMQAVFPD
ncbi:MAG: HAD family hydrolase [Kiritimatiellia bacterium]